MGNRVGVIFHEDWDCISPLLYAHHGADMIPYALQRYLRSYLLDHPTNNNDGHLYDASHMMLGFIQSLDKDVHMRVENLTYDQQVAIEREHEYPNSFDGGCWIINVSIAHFGETECDSAAYLLENDNIAKDELVRYFE